MDYRTHRKIISGTLPFLKVYVVGPDSTLPVDDTIAGIWKPKNALVLSRIGLFRRDAARPR